MPSAVGRSPIGVLRERLGIAQADETADAEGQPVKVWSGFTAVWARAEFLMGRELEAMQKINTEIALRFTVRYRTGITETMRVSWRNESWNIHAILPDERKEYMQLLVSKVE